MPDPTDLERYDAYLAELPDDQRLALTELADAIATAAPDAERAMSYGAPAFKLKGRPLAGFSASKQHLSYLPFSPAVVTAHEAQLTTAGIGFSKGAIRFTPDEPLPGELVTSLVAARRAELER
ncbi:MAG: DUF1801 domain-containing protein [Nocardioidaceae bacterium]